MKKKRTTEIKATINRMITSLISMIDQLEDNLDYYEKYYGLEPRNTKEYKELRLKLKIKD